MAVQVWHDTRLTLSKPALDALQAPRNADQSHSPATRTEICPAEGRKESAVCVWGISRAHSHSLIRGDRFQVTG